MPQFHYWSEDYEQYGFSVVLNTQHPQYTAWSYLQAPPSGFDEVSPLDRFHCYYGGYPYPNYWLDLGRGLGFPFTVLFDRDGYIRLYHEGNLTGNSEWAETIEQLCGIS
mgnify:CR=1 FL=1